MLLCLFIDCPAYTALYDYHSTDVRDLTFSAGDVITVHERNGAWWTGNIGDRCGMFPANYVAPVNPQSVCCHSVSVFVYCLHYIHFSP